MRCKQCTAHFIHTPSAPARLCTNLSECNLDVDVDEHGAHGAENGNRSANCAPSVYMNVVGVVIAIVCNPTSCNYNSVFADSAQSFGLSDHEGAYRNRTHKPLTDLAPRPALT